MNLLVELFDQPSFYDQVLEKMEEDHHKGKVRTISHFELKVSENSFVVGKAVRDIMWPNSLVIISIKRDHENLDKLEGILEDVDMKVVSDSGNIKIIVSGVMP